MNKIYLADLHIHSALSPCGDEEMTPGKIIDVAKQMGLSILAICDHNSSANVEIAMKIAEREGLMLIPGMETECKEEAHILTLFPDLQKLRIWQAVVDGNMSGIINDTRRFGSQLIVNEHGEQIGEETRMLLGPLKLSAHDVVKLVNDIGGICIPAHIDRPAFSLVGQLGFVMKKQGYIAVEVSGRGFAGIAEKKYARVSDNMNIISNSDAHGIMQLLEGSKTEFYMEKLDFEEFKQALQGLNGRYVVPIKSLFEENY